MKRRALLKGVLAGIVAAPVVVNAMESDGVALYNAKHPNNGPLYYNAAPRLSEASLEEVEINIEGTKKWAKSLWPGINKWSAELYDVPFK